MPYLLTYCKRIILATAHIRMHYQCPAGEAIRPRRRDVYIALRFPIRSKIRVGHDEQITMLQP